MMTHADLDTLVFDARGLLPVVAQDIDSGELLMLAWANREALERTLATGEAHYWSRSRDQLWRKGATSGNTQAIVDVRFDCDGDAVLYRVESAGPACHTGERSCFHRPLEDDAAPTVGDVMGLLQRVVDDRFERRPEGSYVAQLRERGTGYMAQKVVEEAGETVVAALEGDGSDLPEEAADLLFHLTVLLRDRGVRWRDVAAVLASRHREG